MATQDGPDFVDRVRSSVDIVSLVSESVPLKKAGRKYRGLCPFHNEKTPSFYIDETKQLFYCFGCSAGGDLFKFVMMREGVEFLEAVRLLARRSGIPVPEGRGGHAPARTSEREAALAACRDASALYREILLEGPDGDVGRNYLTRRGISCETREALGLGYAPNAWDTLRNELGKKGHRPDVMMAAGLLQRREDGSGHYDRFRGRVIFPIVSLGGDVLGFGGRIVEEKSAPATEGDFVQPKYLNSPETLLYNKRENLYGLYHARAAIKEAGEAIVVEGYLDYASLYQAGVRHVVATLGTAFTDEQASLLRRFTERVVVNYDTDAAGQSAAKRSLGVLLSRGFTVRVLRLPSGKDPDAYLKEAGGGDYRGLLDAAPSCFDFLVDSARRDRDLADPSALAAAAREIVPVIAQVPSRIERSRYVGLLSERLGVEDGLLLAEIRDAVLHDARAGARAAQGQPGSGYSSGRGGRLFGGQAHAAGDPGRPAAQVPLRETEMRLVRALVENIGARAQLVPEILPADLEGSPIAGIVNRVAVFVSEGREVTYAALSSALADRERELLARIALRGDPPPGEEEAADCLHSLRRARLVREREGLQKEMESTTEAARLDELMHRKIDLSRRIDALS